MLYALFHFEQTVCSLSFFFLLFFFFSVIKITCWAATTATVEENDHISYFTCNGMLKQKMLFDVSWNSSKLSKYFIKSKSTRTQIAWNKSTK